MNNARKFLNLVKVQAGLVLIISAIIQVIIIVQLVF